MRFGFAVSSGLFENPTTRAIIKEHASIVVTENALNMKYTQPKQGKFNFSEGDKIVRYARELGIDVHGHTASWWHANPSWLTDGTFSFAELEYILANHISTLSKHYDGKLASLIAANEGYLSCGVWHKIGMNNYVQTSFNAARGNTPLIYNSIFPDIQEENKALALLDAGSIDSIGIQLHLTSTADWKRRLDSTDKFLDRLKKRGAWACFSEVGVLATNDQEQAIIYAAVTQLAIKHKDVVRDIIVWGIIPPMWRGDVGIFDKDGIPKPAYWAVMDAL